MTLEELTKLVAEGESDRVEFKGTTGQRGEACRTLCAFLNGDGGTVVFGVSRKGKLTGQLVSDETKKDLARAFCDFEPGIEIQTEYVDVDESHQAIVCRVEGGAQKPYAYDGRPYRRVQSTTVKMPQEQYATLINRRGGFQSKWELQHEGDVSLDDVDLNEVTRTAKIAVAEGRLSADVDVNDPKDLLRRFGLLKGDQPLNGAMALFGKGLMYYPQCILKLAWFKGKDKTIFLDNRMVEGNIIQLQSEAMAFCFKHLNLSGVVRGLYREEELEVPADALREAIINALAHRLYTSSGSVSLAIAMKTAWRFPTPETSTRRSQSRARSPAWHQPRATRPSPRCSTSARPSRCGDAALASSSTPVKRPASPPRRSMKTTASSTPSSPARPPKSGKPRSVR